MRPCCCSCFCSSRTEALFVGLLEIAASAFISLLYSYFLFVFTVNLFVNGNVNAAYCVSMLLLLCGHILGMIRLAFGIFLMVGIRRDSVKMVLKWIKSRVFILFFGTSVQIILFGGFGRFSYEYWGLAAVSFIVSIYLLLVVYNHFVQIAGSSWPTPNTSPVHSPSEPPDNSLCA